MRTIKYFLGAILGLFVCSIIYVSLYNVTCLRYPNVNRNVHSAFLIIQKHQGACLPFLLNTLPAFHTHPMYIYIHL